MLLALAALWGASFMFIKIGDRELQPITLVAFRMGLGALTLAPIVLLTVGARRTVRELRAAARPLVVTGLLNSAIPILAISWAETRIDSGLTAIIQASAPLFAALLALRFSPGERVGGSRLVGLVVGFAGVALLVGGRPSGEILAALAVIFSAIRRDGPRRGTSWSPAEMGTVGISLGVALAGGGEAASALGSAIVPAAVPL